VIVHDSDSDFSEKLVSPAGDGANDTTEVSDED
jgi:hypothetical protein